MENKEYSSENLELLLKRLRGELSPLEEEIFQNWLGKDKRNAELFSKLQDEEQLKKEIDFFGSIDPDKNWERLMEKAHSRNARSMWKQSRKILKYAAVFLVLLAGAALFYKVRVTSNDKVVVAQQIKQKSQDIAPGSDKALLTLADGTTLTLDETTDGVLREFKGLKIVKQGDKVIYEFAKNPNPNGLIGQHTISTPRGGKYQLVLPDGTQVWLNAASSLRFPAAFASTERLVELNGEGYFEVAKNKAKPFKVSANGTTVEVLGTHFNVKAYTNEGASQTSLLEGSVKVSNGSTNTLIKPGEQAIVDLSPIIRTVKADMEQVIAWKEGYFQFNNESFTSVVAQLERWYDVEFVYPNTVAKTRFAGSIPRNSNLSQVLSMLELSGSLTFKVEERRIMVVPQE